MKYGRTAFVVGFMFTVGKYVGEELIGFTEGAIKATLRINAKNGNVTALRMCKSMGIKIDSVAKDTVIGFKAE